MTKEEYRALLTRNNITQAQVGWMCGVNVRQARSWALGEYPVPQYARLLLTAFDQGLLSPEWLLETVGSPPP